MFGLTLERFLSYLILSYLVQSNHFSIFLYPALVLPLRKFHAAPISIRRDLVEIFQSNYR